MSSRGPEHLRNLGQHIRRLTVLEDEALMTLSEREAERLRSEYGAFHQNIEGVMTGRRIVQVDRDIVYEWALPIDRRYFGWLHHDRTADGFAFYLSGPELLAAHQGSVDNEALDQIMDLSPDRWRLLTDLDEIDTLRDDLLGLASSIE